MLSILSAPGSEAKEILVKCMNTMMEPMTVPMQRKDLNGNICALVKVQIPEPGVKFEGNIIDAIYDISEYWVYLSSGSKQMQIKCPGYTPLRITFDDYDIPSLQSKGIYEIQFIFPEISYSGVDNDTIKSQKRMEAIVNKLRVINPLLVHPKRGDLYPYKRDGKWGFLNSNFSNVISPQYDDLNNSEEGYAALYADRLINLREENKWNDDFYWVKHNGLWGCIDKKGKTLIPFKYEQIYQPKEDYSKCRIALVADTLKKFYVINRLTGEVYQEVTDWTSHRNTDFLLRHQSLLHVPDKKRDKDYFYDKITGQKVEIKVPKGYTFRGFLPFNHLNFYKPGKGERILDYKGNTVFDGFWNYPLGLDNQTEFPLLLSRQGLFDLETDQFIYHDDMSKFSDVALIGDDIMEIRGGSHKLYINLRDKTASENIPDIQRDTPLPHWSTLIRNGVRDTIDLNQYYNIFPIDETLFMVTAWNYSGWNALMLLDTFGNYVKMEENEVTSGYLKKLDTESLKKSLYL